MKSALRDSKTSLAPEELPATASPTDCTNWLCMRANPRGSGVRTSDDVSKRDTQSTLLARYKGQFVVAFSPVSHPDTNVQYTNEWDGVPDS